MKTFWLRMSLVVAFVCAVAVPEVKAAPAPPLTSVRVVAVWTPAAGTEFINPGESSTRRDHGGSVMEFATIEMGVARPEIATFNRIRAREYAQEPILGPNRTVIGRIRYWRVVTQVRSGQILYTADSINSNRELTTRLWVR